MAKPVAYTLNGLFELLFPSVTVACATWALFAWSSKSSHVLSPAALDVMEKVGGLLLAALAMELMLDGLRVALPGLAH